MRWRESFLAEVSRSLRQLGLKSCPVCGLVDSLDVGHLPVLLFDGGFLRRIVDHPSVGDCDGDLTFAVRIECTACGYLMLFNAQRFRTANEKIIVQEEIDEEGQFRE